MLSSIDVANFFVNLYKNSGYNDITNLKLNKLVYFAQAFHLAKFNSPLFPDEIEAWKFGPVIPSVYHAFQVCGDNVIHNEAGEFKREIYSPDEIDFLLDIDDKFGIYSAYALVELTHKPGSPWYESFHSGKNAVISRKSMGEYYAKEDFQVHTVDTAKIPVIGKRDKNGSLILPEKEYCREDDVMFEEWKKDHSSA